MGHKPVGMGIYYRPRVGIDCDKKIINGKRYDTDYRPRVGIDCDKYGAPIHPIYSNYRPRVGIDCDATT